MCTFLNNQNEMGKISHFLKTVDTERQRNNLYIKLALIRYFSRFYAHWMAGRSTIFSIGAFPLQTSLNIAPAHSRI